MSAESSGRFTLKELNRIKVLQDVIDRKMTPGRAAVVLGITPRHCSRLIKRYREHGPLGMNNIARGNPSNRLLPKSFTDQIVDIVKKNYPDFGPTLAREKLEEIHGLIIGKETLRRLMIRAGLWIPRKMRAPNRRPCTYIYVYHYPDERKELRLNGIPIPFITYDRLSDVDQGVIVDNKRLGRALELIKTVVDDKRDNRRSQSVPAGNGPSRRKEKAPGKKSQRSIDQNHMLEALVKLQGQSKEIFGKN